MRQQKFALLLGFSAIILLGSSSMEAATITQTFTLDTLSGYSAETGTSINPFDPALGTLDSITFELNATATFSGGGTSDVNNAQYEFNVEGVTNDFDAVRRGDGSVAVSHNFTDSSDLSAFTGSGFVDTRVRVDNEAGTSASISSTFDTETVIYNYTPTAPAVPEPGSIGLIGAALGMWALVRRRRRI